MLAKLLALYGHYFPHAINLFSNGCLRNRLKLGQTIFSPIDVSKCLIFSYDWNIAFVCDFSKPNCGRVKFLSEGIVSIKLPPRQLFSNDSCPTVAHKIQVYTHSYLFRWIHLRPRTAPNTKINSHKFTSPPSFSCKSNPSKS